MQQETTLIQEKILLFRKTQLSSHTGIFFHELQILYVAIHFNLHTFWSDRSEAEATLYFIVVRLLYLCPGVCVKETPRWRIPQEDGRIVRVCFVHRKLIQGQTVTHSVQLEVCISQMDTCCFKALCWLEAQCDLPHARTHIKIYLWYLSDDRTF